MLCGCVDSRQGPKKGDVPSPPLSAVQGSILQFGGQSVFLGEKSSFTVGSHQLFPIICGSNDKRSSTVEIQILHNRKFAPQVVRLIESATSARRIPTQPSGHNRVGKSINVRKRLLRNEHRRRIQKSSVRISSVNTTSFKTAINGTSLQAAVLRKFFSRNASDSTSRLLTPVFIHLLSFRSIMVNPSRRFSLQKNGKLSSILRCSCRSVGRIFFNLIDKYDQQWICSQP